MNIFWKEAVPGIQDFIHEMPLAGPDRFIQKRPPFLQDLLTELRQIESPKTIQDVLDEVVSKSHQHDTAHLITLMMRAAGDPPGLGAFLIGRSHSSKETLKIYRSEEKIILNQLNELPPKERDVAHRVLNGGTADWKTILTLNWVLKQTIFRLRADMNPQAMQNFRDTNETALKALYADTDRKKALATKNPKMSKDLLAAHVPTIIYTEQNGVVYHQYLLPTMPIENQQLLEAILPKKMSGIDTISRINMTGHSIIRTAAETTQVKIKERLEELVRQDYQRLQRGVGFGLHRR